MTTGTEPLLAPLETLAAQKEGYDWAAHDALRFDERYWTRQIPLLDGRPRPAALGPDDIGPGEFWPPARSVALPLDGRLLAEAPPMQAFLGELRRIGVGELVWWQGLDLRVDRVHATLAPSTEARPDVDPAGDDVTVIVRGPWVGHMNCGRFYLPVQAADQQSAVYLAGVRTRLSAPHRVLLAGYLQLTAEVTGAHYRELRDLVAAYKHMEIPMPVRQLWLLDTMDDLVLRSEVTKRLPVSGDRAAVPVASD